MDVWYGEQRKRPTFHTFGCLVHAHIPEDLQVTVWEGRSVKGAYLGPGVQREGHRIVSFDPPLVFESAQVRFVEDRFYFKEFDYDVLKLKYHNRVPSGLLPGIKRPHGTKKVSDKQAVADLMQVKELFGTLTETDRALMSRKRSGVALEESVSRTQKRSKVSPPQVDSQENSSTSREARNETIDNNRIGDKQGSVQAELPITAGVREVDANTTLLQGIPSPTPSSVGKILSSQNTDERVTLAQTDNRAEEDASFDKGKDAESPSGSPVPLPAVGESFQRTYPKKRMTRSERKAHSKRMTPPRKKLVLLSRGRNDTEVRNPKPTRLVSFKDSLTGKMEYAVCVSSGPQNYARENKDKLHQESDDADKEAENELRRKNVSLSVGFAAQLFSLQRTDFSEKIPETWSEAKLSPQSTEWVNACDEEMEAHSINGTFTLVQRTKDMKPIGCRWVFTKKDGGVFKARLVAKGFTQVPGKDYGETYSPVIKLTSMRLLVAIASRYGMDMHHCDVKTAFLNGVLKEELYMIQPPGYSETLPGSKKKSEFVYKLNKSLYGLKQAPQVWNETINKVLKTKGFVPCINEPCLFMKGSSRSLVLLGLYVDDIFIASCDMEQIVETKKCLSDAFRTKDLGRVKKFLGINFDVQSTYTKIHLSDYINSLLRDYGFESVGRYTTPATQDNLDVEQSDGEDECDESEYRSLVGKLLYAANTVRFDIGFAVSKLSRYLISPKYKHLVAAQRVLRYLKGTVDAGLVYSRGDPVDLLCFSDAGCNLNTEPGSRSRTGSIICYGGSPIGWKSKLQTMVSLSTVNAELLALCYTVAESVWVVNLLDEIGLPHKCMVLCDNEGAMKTVRNPALLEGTKHIRKRAHFIQQYLNWKVIDLSYVNTKDNIADILTKALSRPEFVRLRSKGNLRD
ncbi:hypothetical protein OXX79_000063 [Metschnikowia pulcherrima]